MWPFGVEFLDKVVEAGHRWNGALPQTLLEGTGGMPLIGLPPPETAGATK